MITLPIIYGLLNNRNFSHLSGKFKYLKNNFELQINVYPTIELDCDIFVKSVYSIKGETYCNKIKLTIPFIQNLVETYLHWENYDSTEKYPSERFINELKTTLINEFNLTFESYYTYKNDFNEKTGRESEDLKQIFSLNPKINIDSLDEESEKYIKALVNKNVLLYLSN